MKISNKEKLQKILNNVQVAIQPPKKLIPSEFAESNIRWCDGPFSGELMKLHPYQSLPLNQIANPKVRKIVLCSAAQMLKTSLMTASICYLMQNDSANMAYASSTGKETNQYVAAKLQPTIERSGLKHLVTDKNDKTKANNQNQWQLTNGDFLYYMNLNAASTLRSKTLKYCFLDECSNVDVDGAEGNPIALATARTAQFQDGKVMLSSTPKLKDDLIMQEYNLSNRSKYFIKCPHCDHEHEILFENIKFDFKQVNQGKRAIPDADTARLECPECNYEITESQRARAVTEGRWIATNPEETEIVGYSISRLYSPITTIKRVVQEYGEALYNFSLMTFYNNILGLPFDDEYNKDIDSVLLENLRDSSFDIRNIPDDVLGLCMGVDQQLDRLECTTIGFSESRIYVLDHRSFFSPDCTKYGAKSYTELDQYCNGVFKTNDGRKLKVLGAWIDSSNGNATATVYRFCSGKKLFTPIKGSASTTSDLFKKSRTGGHELMMLNVNVGKSTIRRLLNGAVSEDADELPLQLKFSSTLPDDYFEQLTSEELKRKGDNLYWVLKKGIKRAETLDCLNYALICQQEVLSRLGSQPFAKLRKYMASIKPDDKYNEDIPVKQQTKQEQPRRRLSQGQSWFGK